MVMGGPKREFFRQFAAEVYESSFFQGGRRKVFSSNVQGIQVTLVSWMVYM